MKPWLDLDTVPYKRTEHEVVVTIQARESRVLDTCYPCRIYLLSGSDCRCTWAIVADHINLINFFFGERRMGEVYDLVVKLEKSAEQVIAQ